MSAHGSTTSTWQRCVASINGSGKMNLGAVSLPTRRQVIADGRAQKVEFDRALRHDDARTYDRHDREMPLITSEKTRWQSAVNSVVTGTSCLLKQTSHFLVMKPSSAYSASLKEKNTEKASPRPMRRFANKTGDRLPQRGWGME